MKTIEGTPPAPYTPEQCAVTWRGVDKAEFIAPVTEALLSKELYLARRFREGNRYPKQRNYHGLHWFSNTGTHVWYESLFERQALLWLDYTSDIVAIASQPMKLRLANGKWHVPDFIALHADHRQVVYDVKPPDRLSLKTQEQFDETERLCNDVGWHYEVLTDFESVAQRNLDWLSNFRHHYFRPPAAERARLVEALHEPLPLGAAANAMEADRPNAAMAWIYHLLWVNDIQLDLTSPLSKSSILRKEHHALA